MSTFNDTINDRKYIFDINVCIFGVKCQQKN